MEGELENSRQVKVRRHPHDFEVCRQGGAPGAGERPDRALEKVLPDLGVDDVQRIALPQRIIHEIELNTLETK